ncbi:MAG: T9SS type A sorting domain-containing protein [Chitinophagaceae bacterium]
MSTLNLNNNAGANYSYTVNAGANPVTVNASGGTPTADYGDLKGAFDAINAGTHTGTITVLINANTTEVATAALNASGTGAASYTVVTVNPAGGGARTVSGALTGLPLLDLNGADNVTINGLNTGGNSLTLSNTSSGSSSTIRFNNDATGNTVTKCTILGSGTNFAPVYFGATAITTGNDNNTISNCDITAAGVTQPQNGIYSAGLSAAIDNSGNIISNNNIFDYYNTGLATAGMNINSNNSGWTITGNKLYQTATRTYSSANTHSGIQITSGAGYTITGNTIGYASSTAVGTTNMVGNTLALAGFPGSYVTSGTAIATRYVAINAAFTASGTVSNIQGNTIAGFALYTSSGATTTSGIFCAIAVTSGNANIGTTTGNIIGTATSSIYTASTTSGAMVAGIYTTSSNAVTIQNNTIQNIDAMGTSASFSGSINGINTAGAGTLVDISGNTVGNATNPNLRMGNLTTGANLSNAGTTFGAASGTGIFNGILNSSSAVAITIGTATLPNIIRNAEVKSTSTSAVFRGISSSAGTTSIINNTITNLTTVSTQAAFTSGGLTGLGIYTSGGTNQVISRNTIANLSLTNTGTGGYNLAGISFTVPSTAISITRNSISNLSNASTSGTATLPGTVTGIFIRDAGTAGTLDNITNNMINLGGGQTTNTSFIGIWAQYTSSSAGTLKIYHNSINIDGTAAAGAQPSFGFYRGDFSATALTTYTVDARNNIFNNNRGGGTGKHYAIANLYGAATSSSTGWGANASNYNVLNTATAATLGYWTGDKTFAAWQAASAGDGNSVNANPLFVSATDLHLQAGSPAIDVAFNLGVTNDFDGKSRPGANALFDMGADERDGILPAANDIQATAFINPANGGIKLTGVAFSPQASFTNNGTANQTNITVRYRILDPLAVEIYNQTFVIPTLAATASTTVTFPGTTIGTAGVYTIIAKAELVGDVVTANDQITGTLNVQTPLAGTYTVGTGGNYPSLTNNGGMFDAINSLGATANLTINIIADLSGETGANALNEITGGYTVLIKPSGAARVINGTGITNLIKLNGADGVTLDGSLSGGTDQSLTLTNNAGATLVWVGTNLTSGANNNTIKNCILSGPGNFTGQGILASSGATLGTAAEFPNSNNTIVNNTINRVQNGVFISGNTTTLDQNWLVTQNNIGSSVAADKVSFRGILISGSQNFTISKNNISGVSSSTGTSSTMSGIYVNGNINTGIIAGNKIKDIRQNNTGGWGSNGIGLYATTTTSNLTVVNNFVSDIASQGFNGITESDNGYGIMVNTGGGYKIYNNSVSLSTNQVTATCITAAINIAAAVTTVGSLDIRNNIFSNTETVGTVYAIYDASTAGNTIFSSINYNNYFATNIGFLTSARAALANWQTATTQDAGSISVAPAFVNPVSDLHLMPSLSCVTTGKGIAIAGVVDDIDMNSRNLVPFIGAHEAYEPATVATTLENVTGTSRTYLISGATQFLSNCKLIASVTPNGANPISGSTTARVWIETAQPVEFVKRHYEINASSNVNTATGKVTLFFTDAEFSDFNTQIPPPALLLPVSTDPPALIAIEKANLRIEKRGGISNDNTGLPASYSGAATTIDPVDADIVWNAASSRWEVTFDVTGFSGFFVKTTPVLLPIKWLSVAGNLNALGNAAISWKVQEQNVAYYELQKSMDGTSFTTIATINSKGNGTNDYSATENVVLQALSYFKIKQVDKDGRISYSAIVKLSNKQYSGIGVYPNPARDIVTVTVGQNLLNTRLQLTDVNGRVLQQIKIANATFTVNVEAYAAGIYLLKTEDGKAIKIVKE